MSEVTIQDIQDVLDNLTNQITDVLNKLSCLEDKINHLEI